MQARYARKQLPKAKRLRKWRAIPVEDTEPDIGKIELQEDDQMSDYSCLASNEASEACSRKEEELLASAAAILMDILTNWSDPSYEAGKFSAKHLNQASHFWLKMKLIFVLAAV